jgi:hypothetical protein
MLQRKSILRVKILSVLIACVLSACTDLSAVREWSGTSLEATQFNEVVATYADTPERVAFYDKDQASFWETQAKTRRAQAKALELQLSLVGDYMEALHVLSADGVTDYTEDVDQLTGSLTETGLVPESTVGAAGNLATTLLNAATDVWRKGEVGRLIGDANAPLQVILAGELRSIVDKDFRGDLADEAGFLDSYFKRLLRNGGGSETANAALNEWYVLRKKENARRVVAVDAYLHVLDKISEGHQKLYENRNDLEAVQLVKDLFKLAKEIRKSVTELMKA